MACRMCSVSTTSNTRSGSIPGPAVSTADPSRGPNRRCLSRPKSSASGASPRSTSTCAVATTSWSTGKTRPTAIGNGTFVSDSHNWALTPTGKFEAFGTAEVPSIERFGLGDRKHPASFTITSDVDGDGRVDLLSNDDSVYFGLGDISLTRITDGLGKVVEISYDSQLGGGYKPDARCAARNAPGSTWPEKCLPRMTGLVARHSEGTLNTSGFPSIERVYTYTFVNGRMNLTGHGWLGFDRRIVAMSSTGLNNTGTTTAIDYEPVARYTPSGEVSTDLTKPYLYPVAGLPKTTTVDHHIVDPLSFPPLQSGFFERRVQSVNHWQVQLSSFHRPFPVVTSRTTSTYDRPVEGGLFAGPPLDFAINGELLSACHSELSTDGYGNVTVDDGSCRAGSKTVDWFRTTKEFAPDPSRWLISNPENIKIRRVNYGTAEREYTLTYSQG